MYVGERIQRTTKEIPRIYDDHHHVHNLLEIADNTDDCVVTTDNHHARKDCMYTISRQRKEYQPFRLSQPLLYT